MIVLLRIKKKSASFSSNLSVLLSDIISSAECARTHAAHSTCVARVRVGRENKGSRDASRRLASGAAPGLAKRARDEGMCARARVCPRVHAPAYKKLVSSLISLWVGVDVREGCRLPSPRCFGFITRSVSAASLGVFFLRNSTFGLFSEL